MLKQSDVISAVSEFLKSHGYTISEGLPLTAKRGNVILVKDSLPPEIHIEAQGETSSQKNSKKFGKPFSNSQIRIRVARAFLYSAEILSKRGSNKEVGVGIALPDKTYHTCVNGIRLTLKKLGIYVFWVDKSKAVKVIPPWEL